MSTQGWNWYSYVHNNPVIYKDPTGHWTLQWGIGISASAGIGGTAETGIVIGHSEEKGWEIGTYTTSSNKPGGHGDAGVSVDLVHIAFSDNEGIDKLKGESLTEGISIDAGLASPSPQANAEVTIPVNSDAKPSYGFGLGASGSVSPIEVYLDSTTTTVEKDKDISKKINSIANKINNKYEEAKNGIKELKKDVNKSLEKVTQNVESVFQEIFD